jgi:uncharacterized protein YkwD
MPTRLIILIALIAALVLPGAAVHAQSPSVAEEDAFLQAINAARAEQGLPTLTVNSELRDIARGWTGHMIGSGTLAHNPAYRDQYTLEWSRMGENVGYTSDRGSMEATVAQLHQAFLNSSGHRANIMGDYNQVGIGTGYDAAGKLWVTVNFLNGPLPAQDQPEVEQQEPEQQEPEQQEPEQQESEQPEVEQQESEQPRRTHFSRRGV